jgi:ABC-type sugar transport system ATPase subunit
MVFQNYALYPHMTVADNMGFALKMQGVPADERQRRVMEAAELLGLQDFLERKPKALSGGQRQRVAMGRAIVRKPQVFLMDEPLSNLDAKLRVQTRTQIAALQTRLAVTTVYVTHDQVEAMTMGDRVAVLKDGVLQQVDTPLALYDKPGNLFVAGFIGSPKMNLMPAKVVSAEAGAATVRLDASAATRFELGSRPASAGDALTVGVRPEALHILPENAAVPAGMTALPATVESVERLGNITFAYLDGGTPEVITVQVTGQADFTAGQRVQVGMQPGAVHVFDRSGAALAPATN